MDEKELEDAFDAYLDLLEAAEAVRGESSK